MSLNEWEKIMWDNFHQSKAIGGFWRGAEMSQDPNNTEAKSES